MTGKEIATGELMEWQSSAQRDGREGKPIPCRQCREGDTCVIDCPHEEDYRKYLRERPLDT